MTINVVFEVPDLTMGLLFKLLAPMRNVAAIETCARGIDAMAREEAAYWLGMAMHRIRSGDGTTTKTPAPVMVLALFKGISLYPRRGSGCFDGAISDYQKSYRRYR